jgi:hypothetical protein
MTILADHQLPLRLARTTQVVDPSIVIAQPTMLHAIKLCITLGGFESEKQVYGALDIDAGHWSRITRGDAHFPVDRLSALMTLCGNEAPLIWLAHARGYDPASLRKLETDTERRLREAQELVLQLQHDKRVLTEALRGST